MSLISLQNNWPWVTRLLPVTYIAERNNNAFKILPDEEARAILKEEFKENIKTDCQ